MRWETLSIEDQKGDLRKKLNESKFIWKRKNKRSIFLTNYNSRSSQRENRRKGEICALCSIVAHLHPLRNNLNSARNYKKSHWLKTDGFDLGRNVDDIERQEELNNPRAFFWTKWKRKYDSILEIKKQVIRLPYGLPRDDPLGYPWGEI